MNKILKTLKKWYVKLRLESVLKKMAEQILLDLANKAAHGEPIKIDENFIKTEIPKVLKDILKFSYDLDIDEEKIVAVLEKIKDKLLEMVK